MRGPRKLRHLILDAIVSIAVIFGLSQSGFGYSLTPNSPKPIFDDTFKAQAASDLPTFLRDYPKYPHAQLTETYDISSNQPPFFMRFDTTDKPDEVQAFYRDLLSRTGWKLTENDKTGLMWHEWHKYHHYFWGPPEHECIYCYDAYVFARSQPDYTVETNAVVSVVRTVPIYPYARQVKTNDQGNPADIGRDATSATYITTDTPETVLRFYNEILPQTNWYQGSQQFWYAFPYLITTYTSNYNSCSDALSDFGYHCFDGFTVSITPEEAGETHVIVSSY